MRIAPALPGGKSGRLGKPLGDVPRNITHQPIDTVKFPVEWLPAALSIRTLGWRESGSVGQISTVPDGQTHETRTVVSRR